MTCVLYSCKLDIINLVRIALIINNLQNNYRSIVKKAFKILHKVPTYLQKKRLPAWGDKNAGVYSVSRSDFFNQFCIPIGLQFDNATLTSLLQRFTLHLINGSSSGSVVVCYTNVPWTVFMLVIRSVEQLKLGADKAVVVVVGIVI